MRTTGGSVSFSIMAVMMLLGVSSRLRAQVPDKPVLEFTDASLRNWVQADCPAAAIRAKVEGWVVVRFVVEPDGSVSRASATESSDDQFEAAAVKAVSQWTFAPALEEAKPVASGMVTRVKFAAAQWKQKKAPLFPPPDQIPQVEKTTAARTLFAPDPDYPPELEERQLPGEVQVAFTVDATGAVAAPQVLWASHAAFVEAALRALEKTRFEPARQGLVPKASAKRYPVEFSNVIARRAEVLAANGLELLNEPAPATLPQPFVQIEPVYPHARLLAGEGGTATAEFTVSDRGQVGAVTVTAASAPEFGAALQAAVEAWMMRPGMDADGARVTSRLRVVCQFKPPESGSVARLVSALREGGAGVGGAAGLDARLKPLWRGFPVYPAALRAEGSTGEALIEFVIDRGGRVRVPRVKSATREEFGWAAATAISQWVFERPVRQGEPVDVTVSIPVSFSPPQE